jgi:hypothetical protein
MYKEKDTSSQLLDHLKNKMGKEFTICNEEDIDLETTTIAMGYNGIAGFLF